MTSKLLIRGAIALAFATSLASHAAPPPDTTTMTIQASVPGVCRVQNAGVLDFGEVDNQQGNDTDMAATFEWRCTKGTTGTITIDDGGNGNRTMTSALTATPLAYDLYMDPSRTLRWGGAPTEAIIVSGSGMNTPVARSVYGRVEAPDAEAADPANNYQDAVTLSVTW